MKPVLLILFANLFINPVMANDDAYEKLSRDAKLLSKKLELSSANLQMMENSAKVRELREQSGVSTTSVVAMTGNYVFIDKNGMVLKLKVGDSYDSSSIKSIENDHFILSNGKKVYAF